MKKILYIHHTGVLCGAPRSVALLISKLDKTKYIPVVLMLEDGPARKLFMDAGAEVIVDSRLGAFHGTKVSGMSFRLFIRNLLYMPSTNYFGKKIIREINPDLIHLTSTCLFQHAKIAKKINKNLPIITHVREPLLDSIFGKVLRVMNYKYVDAYIAIEEYDLSKMKTKNKIARIVYNFVDFNSYNTNIKSSILRDELNISNDNKIFLYLARISKSNGTLEMVRTLNKVSLDKKYHFVIVGATANKENSYENQVAIECMRNRNIHLLKFRNDIPEVIASSDVMIVPFIEPHFSRTVIEAAAMGIPSIVSNVKGLDELVIDGKTGFIYNHIDENDLINKINKIGNDDSLRQKLGMNAEKRAKKLFDAETNANKTFEVYEELFGKKE